MTIPDTAIRAAGRQLLGLLNCTTCGPEVCQACAESLRTALEAALPHLGQQQYAVEFRTDDGVHTSSSWGFRSEAAARAHMDVRLLPGATAHLMTRVVGAWTEIET